MSLHFILGGSKYLQKGVVIPEGVSGVFYLLILAFNAQAAIFQLNPGSEHVMDEKMMR